MCASHFSRDTGGRAWTEKLDGTQGERSLGHIFQVLKNEAKALGRGPRDNHLEKALNSYLSFSTQVCGLLNIVRNMLSHTNTGVPTVARKLMGLSSSEGTDEQALFRYALLPMLQLLIRQWLLPAVFITLAPSSAARKATWS